MLEKKFAVSWKEGGKRLKRDTGEFLEQGEGRRMGVSYDPCALVPNLLEFFRKACPPVWKYGLG